MSRPVLITAVERAKTVAARWKKQYFVSGQWYYSPNFHTLSIYNQLLELGPAPEPKDVGSIINPGWVFIACDGCKESADAVVQLGQESEFDRDSAVSYLCVSCLRSAIAIVDRAGL